jgi:hypothetical protein
MFKETVKLLIGDGTFKVRVAQREYGNEDPDASTNCNCQLPIKKGEKYASHGNPARGWKYGWRAHVCCVTMTLCEHQDLEANA